MQYGIQRSIPVSACGSALPRAMTRDAIEGLERADAIEDKVIESGESSTEATTPTSDVVTSATKSAATRRLALDATSCASGAGTKG